MKFNSVGGAKYSGYWKDNKKHGYGIIFGNINIFKIKLKNMIYLKIRILNLLL